MKNTLLSISYKVVSALTYQRKNQKHHVKICLDKYVF